MSESHIFHTRVPIQEAISMNDLSIFRSKGDTWIAVKGQSGERRYRWKRIRNWWQDIYIYTMSSREMEVMSSGTTRRFSDTVRLNECERVGMKTWVEFLSINRNCTDLPPIGTDSVKSLTDCIRAQTEKGSNRIVKTRYEDEFESMDEHEMSQRIQKSEEQIISVLRSIRKRRKEDIAYRQTKRSSNRLRVYEQMRKNAKSQIKIYRRRNDIQKTDTQRHDK